MKSYIKIFAPMTLMFVIGLVSFMFAQTSSGNTGKARGGMERGFGGEPGFPPMGPPPGDGFHPGMLERLNLTDEQKTQINALQETARTASQTYFEKLKTFQDELKTATESGTFNEDQVRQILNNRAQTMTELDIIRLKTDVAIRNLLTAEQKAQLEQLKQQRPDFGRGHRPEPPPQN